MMPTMKANVAAMSLAWLATPTFAFAPLPHLRPHVLAVASSAATPPVLRPSAATAPAVLPSAARAPPPSCFLDQADNLAGPLFGASLLPYLVFLYFITADVNRLSATAKAGFTALLTFVFATIVTSIVAVKGCS